MLDAIDTCCVKGERMNAETNERAVWVARTYRLDQEMVAAIDGMAAAYAAPQSRIVGLLLRIGLGELEAGRRYLQRQPIRYAVELESSQASAQG